MKTKNGLILWMACLLAVSCGQQTGSSDVTTQELAYSYKDGKIEIELNIEYPNGSNELLKQAVREYKPFLSKPALDMLGMTEE